MRRVTSSVLIGLILASFVGVLLHAEITSRVPASWRSSAPVMRVRAWATSLPDMLKLIPGFL